MTIEDLQKELELSQFLFQLSPIGILLASEKGEILKVNSFFLSLFGLSVDSSKISIYDPIFQNSNLANYFEICLQEKKPICREISFEINHQEIYAELLFIPLIEKEITIQCILIDLTKKKESEKKIQNIYSYFNKLLSGLSPVATLREDYSIKFVNEPFQKELLKEQKEVLNKNILEVLPLNSKDKKNFLRNLENSTHIRVDNCEFKIQNKIYGYSIFRFDSDIGIILKNITETRGLKKKIEELYAQLMKLQESERQKIARDLHDSVGQTILAAKLNLTAYWLDPLKSEEKFQYALNLIDKTSQELREIYTNIYPSVLKELGLESAIRSLIKVMFGDKYKVKFTYESQAILSEEQSLGIYRIIQEISSNIAKHSQADSIEISIAQKGKTIFLKVIDNGKGFNLNKIQTNRGFGLNNMKIRVEDMGGSLHISSGLGKGTKILIEVPIKP